MVDAALRFVLSNPAVSTVIPGAKTPEQLEGIVTSAGKTLSRESLDRIRELFG